MRKIQIKSKKSIETKLHLVKLVKDYTDLSLKDSKDICDRLSYKIGHIEFITISEDKNPLDFIKEINSSFSGVFEINGGIVTKRDHNLLLLGIGEKEDYIKHILLWCDAHKREELLIKCLNIIPKENLQDLLSELNLFEG